MKITSRIVITTAVICAMGIAGTAIAKGRADGERRVREEQEPRREARATRPSAPEWTNSYDFGRGCGAVNRRRMCGCMMNRRASDNNVQRGRDMRGRAEGRVKADVFSPDMPQEIRMKVVELEKLRIDLREVMTRRDIDTSRAAELNREILRAESEVKAWRFERRLERMAAKKEMRRERSSRADGAPARGGEMKPHSGKNPDEHRPEPLGDRRLEDGKQERPGGEKRPSDGEGEKKPH